MNILDEQISENQRQLLTSWRVRVRQMGHDVGQKGMKDYHIIPFLLQRRRSTFFTLDADFYKRNLCHSRYCLVSMDVRKQEAAGYVRRVLRHPEFDTVAKRAGKVLRVSPLGIAVWRLHAEREMHFDWVD